MLFFLEKDAERYFKKLSSDIVHFFKTTPKEELISKAMDRELDFAEYCHDRRWRFSQRKFTICYNDIICILQLFDEDTLKVHCQVMNTPFGRRSFEINDPQIVVLVNDIATEGFEYPQN